MKTTKSIESVFDSVRLRTDATTRMRSAHTALYLVFQLVQQAQRRRRRIDGVELIAKALDEGRFINEQEVVEAESSNKAAAWGNLQTS